ncbi:hypothetical protein [Mycobacterium sp. 236(2023)]|uniref:hypothetical protein n=1 Tax=Mycobacterium sp. 236(2023) TaxID=3038163 RepID=UPI0024158DEB|nr:hypothetical protein [Mycobacterium sp. 236(2023)]MDG4664205.1 hypothetical protein [Mycobacterium sp. 236(2023)]
MADLSHQTRELRRHGGGIDAGVREAARTGLGLAAVGLVFLLVADMWNGTCTGSLAQAVGCGVPEQAMLALGSPAILLAGGVWSLVRGMRVKNEQNAWLAWQAAGWSLLVLAVLCTVLALPSLPGQ